MVVKVPDEDDSVKHLTDSSAQTFWNSLFIGLIAGVIALLGLLLIGLFVIGGTSDRESAAEGTDSATQAVDGGGVTVTVTWNGMAAGPVFRIAMDTHSVDLDTIDLRTLASLRVDGIEVQPLDWDAPKGGHHREGTLIFPATPADGTSLIEPDTMSLELVVRDVAGVPERIFQWNP